MITAEERAVIPELRSRIEDLNLDWYNGHDLSLLRWLRARDGDVDKAEKMLRKSLDWREANGIDTITNFKFPEDLTKKLPFQIPGADVDGCLIAVVPFGQWNLKEFAEAKKQNLVFNYIDYLFEVLMAVLKERSTPESTLTQNIVVLDYEGFSLNQILSKPSMEMIIQILSRIEANRPELLKVAYIVNAPRVFEIAYKLFKPMMSARTLSKVQVYGPNVTEWKEGLLKAIPHSSLPSNYGGSNSSCTRYKFSEGQNILRYAHEEFPPEDVEQVIVCAGEIFEAKVDVFEGDLLRWSFKTEKYDIGFKLLNEEGEMLLDCPRADAHKFKQNGTFECPSSGTYTLCFDNTYSRFMSKHVGYAVSVTSSDSTADEECW